MVTEIKFPGSVSARALQGILILNDIMINMNGKTLNGQLTSEVVTF